jgi:hypothetical protein
MKGAESSAERGPLGAVIDELHVLVPFWGLAGGVIKVLDYANHAVVAGARAVHLWAPPLPHSDSPVRTLPALRALIDSPVVSIEPLDQLSVTSGHRCLVLFTEPTHYPLIERAIQSPLGARLVHLVQGTRHANPAWNDGYNYRLLHRPMSRIMVTEQVADATRPHTNTRYPTTTILEGHDCEFFASGAPSRSEVGHPLRVLYTTWKSDLGDRVSDALRNDDSITFRAIRSEIGWPELREEYHRSDVLLCTPGPQEGFYLPGLEAMAAGCAVVSALVGGNEAYMVEGHNILGAEYDDVEDHGLALQMLAGDVALRTSLIDAGRTTASSHSLEREQRSFSDFLLELAEHNDPAELVSPLTRRPYDE